jgi:hypothetical protein
VGVKTILGSAAAVLACAVVCAAPAVAEEPDQSFLDTLGYMGISTTDPVASVAMARTACADLTGGMPVLDATNKVATASGMPAGQAAFFTGVAIGAYCPQHEHLLDEA